MNSWSDASVFGLNRSATRSVRGAISFSSSTHLADSMEKRFEKPVTLPPGWARLSAKPLPIGSATTTNTIGIFRVSWIRALVAGVPRPRIASGCRLTNSLANAFILSALPAPQRPRWESPEYLWRWPAEHPHQLLDRRWMCRCRTPQRITNSSSVRKRFPTSACRPSMSSTRRTTQRSRLA